jgi:hypothetical protein
MSYETLLSYAKANHPNLTVTDRQVFMTLSKLYHQTITLGELQNLTWVPSIEELQNSISKLQDAKLLRTNVFETTDQYLKQEFGFFTPTENEEENKITPLEERELIVYSVWGE